VRSDRAVAALPNTSAWYSYGIGMTATRDRTASAAAPGSPVTFAVTATSRSTPSWLMAVGSGRMATVATFFSGTIRPDGVPMSRFPSSVRSPRELGAPHTTTSKIFDCSYRLPTIRPEVSVVASRRTSPGLSP